MKFDSKRGELKGALWNSIASVHKADIIALAKQGERNPARLCEDALKAIPDKLKFDSK